MNFGELVNLCADTTGTSSVEQTERIQKLIRNEHTKLVVQHSLLQATFTKVLTPNVGSYSLTNDLGATNLAGLKTLRYVASGVVEGRFLDEVAPAEIDLYNAVQAVPNNIAVYALAGLDLLMLYPTPIDAGTLTGRYVQRPTAMAADSDTPAALPEEFHDVLWLGAARKIARVTAAGRTTLAMLEPLYKDAMREFNVWLAMQSGAIPAKATVRTRASYIRPHDRSQYPGGGYPS